MFVLFVYASTHPSLSLRNLSLRGRLHSQPADSLPLFTIGSSTENHLASIFGIGQLTYRRAIDIVRNDECEVNPSVTAYLEGAITELAAILSRYPDSYVLGRDEFAVFNYFRQRFPKDIAERAVDRYWRSTHALVQRRADCS
jgi:hypothetical protein